MSNLMAFVLVNYRNEVSERPYRGLVRIQVTPLISWRDYFKIILWLPFSWIKVGANFSGKIQMFYQGKLKCWSWIIWWNFHFCRNRQLSYFVRMKKFARGAVNKVCLRQKTQGRVNQTNPFQVSAPLKVNTYFV